MPTTTPSLNYPPVVPRAEWLQALQRVDDRRAVFAATGSADKTLVVFKAGSHSMFTDRLGTGGAAWNPQVKAATRDLSLTFLRSVFDGNAKAFEPELARHQAMYQDLDSRH